MFRRLFSGWMTTYLRYFYPIVSYIYRTWSNNCCYYYNSILSISIIWKGICSLPYIFFYLFLLLYTIWIVLPKFKSLDSQTLCHFKRLYQLLRVFVFEFLPVRSWLLTCLHSYSNGRLVSMQIRNLNEKKRRRFSNHTDKLCIKQSKAHYIYTITGDRKTLLLSIYIQEVIVW